MPQGADSASTTHQGIVLRGGGGEREGREGVRERDQGIILPPHVPPLLPVLVHVRKSHPARTVARVTAHVTARVTTRVISRRRPGANPRVLARVARLRRGLRPQQLAQQIRHSIPPLSPRLSSRVVPRVTRLAGPCGAAARRRVRIVEHRHEARVRRPPPPVKHPSGGPGPARPTIRFGRAVADEVGPARLGAEGGEAAVAGGGGGLHALLGRGLRGGKGGGEA
jgi:hypothetical protein